MVLLSNKRQITVSWHLLSGAFILYTLVEIISFIVIVIFFKRLILLYAIVLHAEINLSYTAEGKL